METLRSLLLQPDQLTVHVAVNVGELTRDGVQPQDAWASWLPDGVNVTGQTLVIDDM